METRPDTDLAATRSSAPDAFALAVELKRWYGSWLFERALDRHAVRDRYDELRLRLLQTIVATTPGGHRANDARYLTGEILFGRQAFADAAAAWQAIEPDVDDAYFRAYSDVRHILDAPGPLDRVAIRRAIANEYGRWRVFSIDRLQRFGARVRHVLKAPSAIGCRLSAQEPKAVSCREFSNTTGFWFTPSNTSAARGAQRAARRARRGWRAQTTATRSSALPEARTRSRRSTLSR